MEVYKVSIEPKGYFSCQLQSHTIFGALAWAIKFLYGDNLLKEVIADAKEGNLILSSAMPNGYIFKPTLKPSRFNKEELGIEEDSTFRNFIKEFKSMKFIPEELLEDLSQGKVTDDFLLAKKVKSLKSKKTLTLTSIPHANLNRITNSTSVYGEFYFEETYIPEDKLYFLIGFQDSNLFKIIETALNLLQDIGIGGNRSIGFGTFSFSIEKSERFKNCVSKKRKSFITLSSTLATTNIDYTNSYYNLYTLKIPADSGSTGTLIWKPKTVFISEGSFISKVDSEKPAGNILKIDEKIYQFGIEFPIYIEVENEQ